MSYPMGLDEYTEAALVAELDGRRAERRAGRCDYCGRPQGAGQWCRMEARHAGDVPGPQLSLEQFHALNVRRCHDNHAAGGFGHAFATHDTRTHAIALVRQALAGEAPARAGLEAALAELEAWSPADWITAVVGELGELANLVKKRRRGEDIPDQEIRDEWADTFTYHDLLGEALGVPAMTAVLDKFDRVSQRISWPG